MTDPYQQILELLATARAIAETHRLTDLANGLRDMTSDARWHAEHDHEDEAHDYGLQQRREWAREAAE